MRGQALVFIEGQHVCNIGREAVPQIFLQPKPCKSLVMRGVFSFKKIIKIGLCAFIQ